MVSHTGSKRPAEEWPEPAPPPKRSRAASTRKRRAEEAEKPTAAKAQRTLTAPGALCEAILQHRQWEALLTTVDINGSDQQNRTPLQCAVMTNNLAAVRTLLHHGATVDAATYAQAQKWHAAPPIMALLTAAPSALHCSAAANRALFAATAGFRQTMRPLLQRVAIAEPQQQEAVIRALWGSPDQASVCAALQKRPPDSALLRLVLLKALTAASHADKQWLCDALALLPEPQHEHFSTAQPTLRHFGMVFGDSFITEGSSLSGDLTGQTYADFAVECLKGIDTPLSRNLQAVLDKRATISLRGKLFSAAPALHAHITAQLGPNGPGRCVLFGGWSKHAIVYEVERASNGTYTFRVYNEGEGSHVHPSIQPQYKERFGCIAIEQISPDRLSPDFLCQLIALCYRYSNLRTLDPQTGKRSWLPDPWVELKHKLLPRLGGKEAVAAPEIGHYLSPQRGGTCTYRSLLAFLATHLPPSQYKQLKFDLKMRMLGAYMTPLRAEASRLIDTEDKYKSAKLQLSVVRRAIEKFAAALPKLAFIISPERIAEANALMLEYRHQLTLCENQLIAYQKGTQECQLGVMRGHVRQVAYQATPVPQPEAAMAAPVPQTVGTAADGVLQRIDAIDSPAASPGEVQGCLFAISALTDAEDVQCCTAALFRRMGSLAIWNNPQWYAGNTPELVAALKRIVDTSSVHIANVRKPGNRRIQAEDVHCAERYVCFFTTAYLLERAYFSLPEDARGGITPSSLTAPSIQRILPWLRCAEPWLTRQVQELRALAGQEDAYTPLVSKREECLELDPRFCQSVVAWYCHPQNAPLRARIAESVAADRAAQAAQIAAEQHRLRVLIARASAKSAIAHEAALSVLPQRVAYDMAYWPQGFEYLGTSDARAMSVEDAAAFLLIEGGFIQKKLGAEGDFLPVPLRASFDAAVATNWIFDANADKEVPPCIALERLPAQPLEDPRRVWEFKAKDLWAIWSTSDNLLNYDVYHMALQPTQLSPLYRNLASYESWENAVPAHMQQNPPTLPPGIDSDLAQELYSLCEHPNVQADAVLSFFSEHRELLADPAYLNLFHSLLFEGDCLARSLRDMATAPHLAHKLEQFFGETIAMFRKASDLSTASTLFWIATQVQSYASAHRIIDQKLLIELVEDAIKAPAHIGVAMRSLFASCRDLFQQLPHTEAEWQLFAYRSVALLLSNQFPLAQGPDCIPRLDDYLRAGETLRLLLPRLESALVDQALNQYARPLLAQLYPDMHQVTLSLASGQMIPNDPARFRSYTKPVPYEVCAVLQSDKCALYAARDDMSALRCYVEGAVTHIYDAKRQMHLQVHRTGNIYVQGEDGRWWLHAIPKDFFRIIETRYFEWSSGKDRLLVDRATRLEAFRYRPKEHDFVDQQGNCLMQDIGGSNPFEHFEQWEKVIFVGNNQGAIRRISFPRLHLALVRDGERFCVEGDRSWSVASEQFVPYLAPPTGFLVLENNEGKKKVLLPIWPAEGEGQPGSRETLCFPYAYDFFGVRSQDDVRYVECTLQENTLAPLTREGRFYLAKLFLEKGETDQAETLLFAHEAKETTRAHTPEERQLLEEIAIPSDQSRTSGDTGSRTCLLRMRALYLLEHNAAQYPRSEPTAIQSKAEQMKEQLRIANKAFLVREYLSRLGHIRGFSEDEERTILDAIPFHLLAGSDLVRVSEARAVEPLVQQRRAALEGVAAEQIAMARKSTYPAPSGFALVAKMRYHMARRSHTFPFALTDVSRDDFFNYFDLLTEECKGASSWEAVTSSGLLSFLSHQSRYAMDGDISKGATFLLGILKGKLDPQQQPTPTMQEFLPLGVVGALPADCAAMAETFFAAQPPEPPVRAKQPLFDPQAVEVTDATVRTQFERTAADLAIAEQRDPAIHYSAVRDPSTLRDILKDQLADHSRHLLEMGNAITSCVGAALMADPRALSQLMAKTRSLPGLEELCVFCCQNTGSSPELSPTGLQYLKTAVMQYLVEQQTVQQLQRAFDQANDVLMTNDPKAKQSLVDALHATLAAERAYDLLDPLAPQFLYLESTLNIKLRPDQIANIRAFVAAKEEKRSIVLQAIMGAGKTSVLQPLLAFLFAEPHTLSTVIVPPSLFEPIREGLSKTLGSAFEQSVYTLLYDRKGAQNLTYLETVLNRLKEAQECGAVLLLQPEHKHSMLTSLYEAYREGDEQRITAIAKICSYLQIHEADQIDEIDLVMDPAVRFIYPVGKRMQINAERGLLLSNILLDLAHNPPEGISIDFIDAMRKRFNLPPTGGAAITKELYALQVQPLLVAQALQRLVARSDAIEQALAKDSKGYIRHFLAQTTLNADKGAQRAWLEAHIPDLNDRQLLSVCAKAIGVILPSAMLKECGAHYGKDPLPGQYVARPYDAPNAPKQTMYANPYEQVIYTMQQLLFEGIPHDGALKLLQSLQKTALEDPSDAVRAEALQRIRTILGAEAHQFALLQKPTETYVTAFHDALNRDPQAIIYSMQQLVFPQIALYEQNVSSTAQTLTGSSAHACGYTATPHQGIMARGMEVIPEQGTDGQTIAAVQHKMEVGTADVQVYEAQLLDSIIDRFVADPTQCVFLDGGGWLKEEPVERFVQRLLERCKRGRPAIEGIIYHAKDGTVMCYDGEHKPLSQAAHTPPTDSYLTVIAQKYTMGTNILQPPTAHAVMSIRKGMTLPASLQTIFRMRQILQGQSTSFVLSTAVRDHVAAGIVEGYVANPAVPLPPSLAQISPSDPSYRVELCKALAATLTCDAPTLWRYFATNQARAEQRKNWLAAKQRMREVIERPLRAALCDLRLPLAARQRIFTAIPNLFVQSMADSPWDEMIQPREMLTGQQAIDKEVHHWQQAYAGLSPELQSLFSPDLEAALRGCVDVDQIPPLISGAEMEEGLELEQEEEEEEELEVRVQLPVLERLQYRSLTGNWSSAKGYRFNDLFGIREQLVPKPLQRLRAAQSLSYSRNLIPAGGVPDPEAYRLPARYVLAIEQPRAAPRYVLLSHADAGYIAQTMVRGGTKPSGALTIYDLNRGAATTTNSSLPPASPLPIEVGVVAKLTTGRVFFTEDELNVAKGMLSELSYADRKAVKAHYEKIVKRHPHAARQYYSQRRGIRKLLNA